MVDKQFGKGKSWVEKNIISEWAEQMATERIPVSSSSDNKKAFSPTTVLV